MKHAASHTAASRAETSAVPAASPGGGSGGTRLFLSRELSWLDFNERVLDEAVCRANPLQERLKFIAITAENLDEFFMVRIAKLRQRVRRGDSKPDPAGNDPAAQFRLARKKIVAQVGRQYEILLKRILPELAEKGICFVRPEELTPAGKKRAGEAFRRIMPKLTPLVVDPAGPPPPLDSGAIGIALRFIPAGKHSESLAIVEIPADSARFVELPGRKGEHRFLLPEELITANLKELFPGGRILECLVFRITRDTAFSVSGKKTADLPRAIERKLLRRNRRELVRLEVAPATPGSPLVRWLRSAFAPDPLCFFAVPGPLDLKRFSALNGLLSCPELEVPPFEPVTPPELAGPEPVLDAVRKHGDILIALPYHDFSSVVRMLDEAARDPDVVAISQTLYRVGGSSPVIRALRQAALNGKKVTAVLELRARFDEENNLAYARELESCGVRVICGIPGLKVHAKALLIVRRESGKLRRYCHLGTGNYNDRTARVYTDMGLMTCDRELCADIAAMFDFLTGDASPEGCRRKAVLAPFRLRSEFVRLIEREIEHARSGERGEIIAKINGLADEKMVRLIHRAAAAGVEITLLVRGICCCRPLPEEKELRIISIVDRFLEHGRIFFFANGGNEEFFLSSADWMTRNLDRRVELMFPVEDPVLKGRLSDVLKAHIEDRDKGRRLLPSGKYTPTPDPVEYGRTRSQMAVAAYFAACARRTAAHPAARKTKNAKHKELVKS